MWKMLHADNAIEAMAVTVRFPEPLSSLVTKRVLREFERTTSQAGLINRQPVQGIQVEIQSQGQFLKQVPLNGTLFQRTSLTRVGNEVVNQLTAQMEVQPSHLILTTWRYRSWLEELAFITDLFGGGFKSAVTAVPVSSIRLEYVDRFIFEGANDDARAIDLLNQESEYISRQVFEAKNLWHSHTGRFENTTDTSRELLQVNIDSNDVSAPSPHAGRRTVAIMTAAEDQYLPPGHEIVDEEPIEYLGGVLKKLHKLAISKFREVLNIEFAKQNGLMP